MTDAKSAMRARSRLIIRHLERAYPDARIALDFTTPLELLVATILAAQCTDERVNQVTKSLFQKYRTAQDYAAVPIPRRWRAKSGPRDSIARRPDRSSAWGVRSSSATAASYPETGMR